ncbi:hypothetical protein GOA59_31525 [Sinorhizobium meliloti]|nr:hypothetical protein [Sinorhizobium meliloti]MDX0524726.1 hypothetical protein [Sinorhizobium medicae]MDW9558758.1 hypothetical protein [Sinorhizobium meliloti]MDW9596115.1 hypothetical protein [Sinorhizobium meliloti]MDW9609332.1 hypothetical protein [Sinorhizobium meliloti]
MSGCGPAGTVDPSKIVTAELVEVLAGERSQPSVEVFIAELPAFLWPQL